MMLISWVLLFVVSLTFVGAEINTGEAVSKLPACSLACYTNGLAAAQCPLTDIQNCLCRNATLQTELFVCVYQACNVTEQSGSADVSQNLICEGVPKPSRGTEVIRAVVIIATLTFPIIVLRLISRYILRRIWYDDWIVIAAGILMIPMCIIPILNVAHGFGSHAWDVPSQNQTFLRQLFFVNQLLYTLIQGMAKLTILLLYLRIFPNPRFRLIIQLSIGWISTRTLLYLLILSLQCLPVKSLWQLDVPSKCFNSEALIFSGAALSIFEDLVIMILPISELRGLSMSVKKRCVLVFMFALGSFACITSMIRLRYLVKFSTIDPDASWVDVDLVIWSIIETFSAMICASLISIRPLLVKYFPAMFGTSASNSFTKTKSKPTVAATAVASWKLKYGSGVKGVLGIGRAEGMELTSRENVNDGVADFGARGKIMMTREFEVREVHLEDGNLSRD